MSASSMVITITINVHHPAAIQNRLNETFCSVVIRVMGFRSMDETYAKEHACDQTDKAKVHGNECQ